MRDIFFCRACEVNKKGKCREERCAGVVFKDFEEFFKRVVSDGSKGNCDLLFRKSNRCDFIELKSTDRYTHECGSLYSLSEVAAGLTSENKETRKLFEKIFGQKNAIKKFTNSMELHFLKCPADEKKDVRYFFFFSTAFVDYLNKKNGVKIEYESVKLLLLQTLFALYPHNPVFHNGKRIPLKVGSCLEADVFFK